MRSRRRRQNILAAVGLFIFAACGGTGSCAGCDLEPLPEEGLPVGQTIEGAAQGRVTPAGFDKISELVPTIVNELLEDGICVPRQSGTFLGVSYEFCHQSDCVTEDANPGCQVNVNLDSIDVGASDTSTLAIDVQFDGDGKVPARYGCCSCTFDLNAEDLIVEADIRVGTDTRTGDLDVGLDDVRIPNIDNLDIGGCSFVSGFASFVKDTIGGFIIDFLTPFIDDFVQGLLPDPLGLEGVLDATPFITQFRPQTDVKLEVRAIPGGYADLENGGLNLGLIAGLNTDFEPEDRSFGNETTPSPCVPPMPAPDFSVAPHQLPRTARGTFHLPAAGAFIGDPDPEGQDVVFGVSETALNLIGYHAFASGALCLGLDTSMVPQLNLGTIGILVPSLSELGSERGKDPLLVVTRPQRPIEATIGDGTEDSPNLTIHVRGLELDVYAFLFERFVRGFTLKVDLDLGIGVELVTDDDGKPALLPTLSGLDTKNIAIEVLNPDFLREDKESLESVIPALFDLVVPRLSRGLGTFALPEVAGFTLTELEVGRIATEEDDFLSIAGAFGSSTIIEALAEEYPQLRDYRPANEPSQPARADTRAELRSVRVPAPDEVYAALAGEPDARLPEVVIDVDTHDELGRPLEWTWRIDGGMWRSFSSESPLVIRDRAFAFQGNYEIEVKARARGDYRTIDRDAVAIPAAIDSAPPKVFVDRARADGDQLIVPASDAVTPAERIERALGHADTTEPATAFATGHLDLAGARRLAGPDGAVRVFARDEAGNETYATLDLHAVAPHSGGCQTGGGNTGTGAAIVVALCALFLRVRARVLRRVALAAAAAALMASAGCGSPGVGEGCIDDRDCAAECDEDQIPICTGEGCLCDDDVPLGRVGQYSALAVDSSGDAWVSAYNATYGDLVVARASSAGRIPREAWTFVDGVPDGPVVVENSRVRGGVFRPGPNLGLYTDIAVSRDDVVLVSYFDADEASLKLATFEGGSWDTHVVDAGVPGAAEGPYEIVGQYSSITLDREGRPGVAYFVQSSDGGEDLASQVRFAQASSARPTGSSDWDVTIVEDAEVATVEADEDTYPIPLGIGLYVAAARYQDDRPVLVYYDRIEGTLRSAEMSASGGGFSEPSVLDDGSGLDVGRFPSIAVDNNDNLHVSYVSADRSELLYFNSAIGIPEIVDDGYRVRGSDDDGVPAPEFHFVGDDSSIVVTAQGPVISYQDATTHELLLAHRGDDDEWERSTLAGNDEPFAGGYGFYTSAAFDGTTVLVSNWVIDQPRRDSWVELHRRIVIE